jgi:hypothetical protein
MGTFSTREFLHRYWDDLTETAWYTKEHNMGIHPSQLPDAPKPHQAIYAAQLLESLSDVVDTLNEALADNLIFQFQISRDQVGKFLLTSLTCTHDVMPKALVETAN